MMARQPRDLWRGGMAAFLRLTPGVECGHRVGAVTPVRVRRTGAGKILIGDDVDFRLGVILEVRSAQAHIRLGDRVFINDWVYIAADQEISIGRDSLLSWGVSVFDTNMHGLDGDRGARPVSIGEHVWIGAKAMILPGVSVGDGAVIGAGSVVTRDVRPGMLAVGNPATELRTVTWTR